MLLSFVLFIFTPLTRLISPISSSFDPRVLLKIYNLNENRKQQNPRTRAGNVIRPRTRHGIKALHQLEQLRHVRPMGPFTHQPPIMLVVVNLQPVGSIVDPRRIPEARADGDGFPTGVVLVEREAVGRECVG